MFLLRLVLACGLMAIAAPVLSSSDAEFAAPGPVTVESVSVAPEAAAGYTVSLRVKFYTETETRLEIRDALGKVLFTTLSTYPEGEREINVSLAHMEPGAYFVRLRTGVQEYSELITVE